MSRRHVVVLTGAGISADSGVDTYRDAGGLWEGHRFEEVATPEEVLTRVEKLAADLVLATLRSEPPATPVPAAAISFTVANVRRDGAVLVSSDGPLAAHRVPLSATTTLSLRDPNKRRAERYARIWTMLASSHAHLRRNEKVTQRGLYYLMSSGAHTSSLFPDPATVNSALLDAVSLVAVSRRSLGVVAAPRGEVGGAMSIREGEDAPWRSLWDESRQISGDIAAIARWEFRGDFRYVLVVEKHSVFHRFVWRKRSCILTLWIDVRVKLKRILSNKIF